MVHLTGVVLVEEETPPLSMILTSTIKQRFVIAISTNEINKKLMHTKGY